MLTRLSAAVAFGIFGLGPSFGADLTVGFVTALSGPGASIGIPYGRGIDAAQAYAGTIGETRLRLVKLDDASDPSAAARNARKLIEEEKADVILGTSGAPAAFAMAAVAAEMRTPMLSLSPINPPTTGPTGQWVVSIPQPPALMVSAVVERMKKDAVKRAAYIGFSDAWGDLVYDALMKNVGAAGIEVPTNERYARADTSVTAQVLKMIAQRPDAVITGGAGTPGALPYLALAERGFRGGLYGTHALINPDFVRVGGQAVEGVVAPTGPVVVAEQLPDNYPTKKIALEFRAAHQKANNMPATDAFSAYSFDAWLVLLDAAKRALATAKPGSPEFRTALRDAIITAREVIGTHGIYNYKSGEIYGVDDRARVLVRLTKGEWKLLQ
jgi:branched-chain amino acid transport system substrate-binding protein